MQPSLPLRFIRWALMPTVKTTYGVKIVRRDYTERILRGQGVPFRHACRRATRATIAAGLRRVILETREHRQRVAENKKFLAELVVSLLAPRVLRASPMPLGQLLSRGERKEDLVRRSWKNTGYRRSACSAVPEHTILPNLLVQRTRQQQPSFQGLLFLNT